MKCKMLMGALALSCAAILSGCSQDDGKIVIRMAQASAADGAIGLSMDNFAKDVEAKSNGRIVVHTFHNGQLGTERENIESVQMGNLDIAVVNQSVLVNFFPDISVFDLPYTITSAEHADKKITNANSANRIAAPGFTVDLWRHNCTFACNYFNS